MPSGRDSFRRNRVAPLVRVHFSMFDGVRTQSASFMGHHTPGSQIPLNELLLRAVLVSWLSKSGQM
jgi:hypothetical protein